MRFHHAEQFKLRGIRDLPQAIAFMVVNVLNLPELTPDHNSGGEQRTVLFALQALNRGVAGFIKGIDKNAQRSGWHNRPDILKHNVADGARQNQRYSFTVHNGPCGESQCDYKGQNGQDARRNTKSGIRQRASLQLPVSQSAIRA